MWRKNYDIPWNNGTVKSVETNYIAVAIFITTVLVWLFVDRPSWNWDCSDANKKNNVHEPYNTKNSKLPSDYKF